MWCMSHPNLQSTQQEPKTVPSATKSQPRHIAIAAKEGKGAALRGTRHPLFAWCSLHLWRRGKQSMTKYTVITLPESNMAHENNSWKGRFLFKTIIFRCYVSSGSVIHWIIFFNLSYDGSSAHHLWEHKGDSATIAHAQLTLEIPAQALSDLSI